MSFDNQVAVIDPPINAKALIEDAVPDKPTPEEEAARKANLET